MRSSILVPLAAVLASAVADPIPVRGFEIAERQQGYGGYTPHPYGPLAYSTSSSSSLQAYIPAPMYGTGSTATTDFIIVTASVPSSSSGSTEGSPVGFSNTTSLPLSAGATSTTARDITTAVISHITLTLSTLVSAYIPSSSHAPPYNWTYPANTLTTGTGFSSTEGSMMTATGSSSIPYSTGTAPYYGNSTTSLGTGMILTSTVHSTSFVAVMAPSSIASPPFSSKPRTDNYSAPSTGSTPGSPITGTSVGTTGLPTWAPPGASNSPIYYSNSTTVTGTVIILTTSAIWGSWVTAPSSTLGSPVTAGNPTSSSYPTATRYSPVPYSSYITSYGTGLSTPGSTEGSPITASVSSSGFTPSFSSHSRLLGTATTTNTVSNLETMPTVASETSRICVTATPSLGFSTVTTAPGLPVPYGSNTPYAYPTATYAGPSGYGAYGSGYGYGYGQGGGGGWFGGWFGHGHGGR